MSKTYRIVTIADIYALPDADAMRRCLNELAVIMPQARALGDLLDAAAQKALSTTFERVDWIDDDKGELGVRISGHDGAELMRMDIKRNSTEGATP